MKEAKRRRDELESQTLIQFHHIQMGRRTTLELPGWKSTQVPAGAPRGPAEWGSLWREALADAYASGDAKAIEQVQDLAVDEAERYGKDDAKRHAFTDAFTGREAVDHHLEAYLSTVGLAPKTTGERRGLVGKMARWAASKGLTLDRIDRRQASKYVTEEIDPLHPVTQTKHLMALWQHWIYLAKRGHIDLPAGEDRNSGWPWDGQKGEA